MEAVVWSDYLCPWCYVGQDRTALLRSLGVTVTVLPYELRPDVPAGGVPTARRYRGPTAEAEDAGMPFRPPTIVPNTHQVLAVAEWVRRRRPERFNALHRTLFAAYFAEGLDIGVPDVLHALVERVGIEPTTVEPELGFAWLAESMAAAREADVFAVPAWRFETGAVISGVQPRAFYERVVQKLTSTSSSPPS